MTKNSRRDEPYWQATTLEGLWREQLEEPTPEQYPHLPEQARGWLLAAGLGPVLTPFVGLPYLEDDLADLQGLDGEAAEALLRQLPESALEQRQNSSPTMRSFLKAIAEHPAVRGIGYVVGPDRADERISLTGVLIDDPELLTFKPDVELGPIPAMLSDLDEDRREEYLEHLHGCRESSIWRQKWFAARHRYGLRDAETGPTEITTVNAGEGSRQVRLWWT